MPETPDAADRLKTILARDESGVEKAHMRVEAHGRAAAQIVYGKMYDAPPLNFDTLKALSDLFGTTHIDVDDYGSSGWLCPLIQACPFNRAGAHKTASKANPAAAGFLCSLPECHAGGADTYPGRSLVPAPPTRPLAALLATIPPGYADAARESTQWRSWSLSTRTFSASSVCMP